MTEIKGVNLAAGSEHVPGGMDGRGASHLLVAEIPQRPAPANGPGAPARLLMVAGGPDSLPGGDP